MHRLRVESEVAGVEAEQLEQGGHRFTGVRGMGYLEGRQGAVAHPHTAGATLPTEVQATGLLRRREKGQYVGKSECVQSPLKGHDVSNADGCPPSYRHALP